MIVPQQTIKCKEYEATNFSQREANVKDIYCRRTLKNNLKEWKVENVVTHVRINHIQKENPRENSIKIFKLLQKVKSDFQDAAVCFLGILTK